MNLTVLRYNNKLLQNNNKSLLKQIDELEQQNNSATSTTEQLTETITELTTQNDFIVSNYLSDYLTPQLSPTPGGYDSEYMRENEQLRQVNKLYASTYGLEKYQRWQDQNMRADKLYIRLNNGSNSAASYVHFVGEYVYYEYQTADNSGERHWTTSSCGWNFCSTDNIETLIDYPLEGINTLRTKDGTIIEPYGTNVLYFDKNMCDDMRWYLYDDPANPINVHIPKSSETEINILWTEFDISSLQPPPFSSQQ